MRRRSGHEPNSSFKPTPHHGVCHVPALREHASGATMRGGSTQGDRRLKYL
jgi:hypothetical protein